MVTHVSRHDVNPRRRRLRPAEPEHCFKQTNGRAGLEHALSDAIIDVKSPVHCPRRAMRRRQGRTRGRGYIESGFGCSCMQSIASAPRHPEQLGMSASVGAIRLEHVLLKVASSGRRDHERDLLATKF